MLPDTIQQSSNVLLPPYLCRLGVLSGFFDGNPYRACDTVLIRGMVEDFGIAKATRKNYRTEFRVGLRSKQPKISLDNY